MSALGFLIQYGMLFLIQESFPNCELDTMFHSLPHSSVDSIFQCGQSQKENLTRLTILVYFYFIVTGTILGKRAICKQLRVLQGDVQVCFEVEGANTNGSSESHEKIVQSKLLVEADGMPVVPIVSHYGWKEAPWIQENKPECCCL